MLVDGQMRGAIVQGIGARPTSSVRMKHRLSPSSGWISGVAGTSAISMSVTARIHFCTITVIAFEIGLLTPPFGIGVFTVKSTLCDPKVSVENVFAGNMP